MTPTFNNKDLILTTKFFFKLKINDVVLVDTSEFGIALKRIQFPFIVFLILPTRVSGDCLGCDYCFETPGYPEWPRRVFFINQSN